MDKNKIVHADTPHSDIVHTGGPPRLEGVEDRKQVEITYVDSRKKRAGI